MFFTNNFVVLPREFAERASCSTKTQKDLEQKNVEKLTKTACFSTHSLVISVLPFGGEENKRAWIVLEHSASPIQPFPTAYLYAERAC